MGHIPNHAKSVDTPAHVPKLSYICIQATVVLLPEKDQIEAHRYHLWLELKAERFHHQA